MRTVRTLDWLSSIPLFMKRLFAPFKGLGWKLTLSYTLVTVGALLVVELAGLLLLQGLISSNIFPRIMARAFRDTFVPDMVQFLQGPSPDVDGLKKYLALTFGEGEGLSLTTGGGEGVQLARTTYSGDATMVVLDAAGNFLAASPPRFNLQTGEAFDPQRIPGLSQVLPAALNGETNLDRLFVRIAGDRLVIAVPISAGAGQPVLGAFIFSAEHLQPFGGSDLQPLLSLLGGSLLVFTIAAGAVGTIFGFFTARALSRRLRTVAEAADSWSRGDFSAFIKDRSADEIGQLSGHLNRMAEQLQNLLQTRQQLATLEERNRLARELHDSVKQEVFAAAMQVGAARALLDQDPKGARIHLEEAESLARQAQTELSTLIRELRPAELEDRGLPAALRGLLDSWSRQTGIPSQLRLQGERNLSLPVEQALFRVAQEALANIARHSQATQVEVRLQWEKDQVRMTVADNGAGFDPQENLTQGVGLHSMQERLEALGGSLSIASSPGEGTRIAASIPTT